MDPGRPRVGNRRGRPAAATDPAAGPGGARIGAGDRVTLIGKTGSGKTTLALHYVSRYARVVIVDPKARLVLAGWPIVVGARAFEAAYPKHPRLVWRPAPTLPIKAPRGRPSQRTEFNDVCARIFKTGNTALYVDEVMLLADANDQPIAFNAILTMGRELRIPTWCATQRPSRIPPTVISEAEHVIVFALHRSKDRETVADNIGADVGIPKHRHGYLYWSPALTAPIECAPLDRVHA